MGFEDFAFAARMRDLITGVAETVVNRMRPEPRLGMVYDFTAETHYAEVRFAGDDQTIRVRFDDAHIPRRKMMDNPDGSAVGDVVWVEGKPGSYRIGSFQSGTPVHLKYEYASNPVGAIIEYGGEIAPLGYIFARGQFVPQTQYPELFAVYGHKYNSGIDPGDGTFKIPDRQERFALGATTSFPLGSTGGVTNASLTLSTGQLPPHYHDIGHDHGSTSNDGLHRHNVQLDTAVGGGTASVARGSNTPAAGDFVNPIQNTSSSHAHNIPALTNKNSGTTGSGSAINIRNPYIAVNFIVKT